MAIKLGMCGFTIGAATYYRKFSVVEVQQTFYDPPQMKTLERWRSEAPADAELQQIHDWLPADDETEAYVLFNNVPRTKDVKRFRELGFETSASHSAGTL